MDAARMTILLSDGAKRIKLASVDSDDTGKYDAEGKQSLLVVFQATDTGGKDGVIQNVFRGVNPQGCRVWGFGVPSEEEASHDAL